MKYLVKLFLAIFLLTNIAWGSDANPTQEEVAKLYVATFNRAPDAAGLDYWVDSGLTLAQIAQSFFDQTETQTLYPATTTNREFVQAVYQNLFNRDPDAAGWDYWENELNSGNISKNRFIEAVINGALGDDATILANKTEVGIYFAEQDKNDVEDAKNIMKLVTKDVSSVITAKQYILDDNIPVPQEVKWLDEEPDGYYTWSEAKAWCEAKGYRLPVMDELLLAWKEGGSQPSPDGFTKDTFYWSLDPCLNESGCHQGCAMDAICPTFAQGDGWNDDANGHPKCVVSSTISCEGHTIHIANEGETITMKVGETRYFDTETCGAIEVMTSQSDLINVNIDGCSPDTSTCDYYYNGNYMNVSLSQEKVTSTKKIKVTAIAVGKAGITLSDNTGATGLSINVE